MKTKEELVKELFLDFVYSERKIRTKFRAFDCNEMLKRIVENLVKWGWKKEELIEKV